MNLPLRSSLPLAFIKSFRHLPTLLSSQILKAMKLIIVFLTAFLMQVSAGSFAQNVTIRVKDAPLSKVFREIEKQTGYGFLYTQKMLQNAGKVTLDVKDEPVGEVLQTCFSNQPLQYFIQNNTIIISEKKTIPVPTMEVPVIVVSGQVNDEEGKPLAGVSVVEKGTKNGTMSNSDGKYILSNVSDKGTLVFTFVGYQDLEMPVRNRNVINVNLKLDIQSLDETVVIGYGSLKRRDLTGSISSVSKKVLDNPTFSDIGYAIQGQMAGVNIITGDGSPGEPVQVTVRGIGSMLGNTSPLLVVDEVPMPAAFNLNDLNPNNIKSIDVLKGASASAIYGSRAASGVFLIQTKRGQYNEKPTISYSYKFGLDKMASKIDVLSTDEWKYMLFEGARNAAIADGITDITTSTNYKNYTAPGFFRDNNTNWLNEMLQPSTHQTHNLSIRGGSSNASYTGAIGLTNDQGIMKNSGFKRYNFNLGLDNKITSKLTTELSINASFSNRDAATASLYDAIFGRPDYPAYNDDGTPFENIYYLTNGDPRLIESPLSKLLDNINNTQSHLIGISGYLQYNFLKKLSIRSRVNYNLNEARTKLFYANTTSLGSGTGFTKSGSLTDSRLGSTQIEWENQLNYSFKFRNHNFDLLAATSFLQENRRYASISFDDFPDNSIQNEFYQGATYKGSAGYNNKATMMSYIGRLNYNYNGKYLLTASIRRDGSSKFSPSNAYGTFPSVAAAWNISQEPFLKGFTWLNYLKLRAGFGKTGMADVGYYGWRTLYQATNYNGASGVIPSQAGNENLKWENSDQTDIGVDFQLFNSRLRGSIGYYVKNTDGLLYPFTLAPSTGFSNVTVNFAKVRNSGFDIELQLDVLKKRDLSWSVGFNLNNNKNRVTKLDKDYITGTDGSQALSYSIIKEGYPFGLIYGFKTNGIYKNWKQVYADNALNPAHPYQRYMLPGEVRYKDLNGDGWVDMGVSSAVSNPDRTVIGHSLPDFSGGLSTSFTYKQWGLNIFGTYSVGNDKVWVQELYSFSQGTPALPRNMWRIVLDRWTPENSDSRYPSFRLNRTTISREFSDFSVYDDSYLKIQNVQVLYNLNQRTLSKLKAFSNIQVYGSVNNLYTFTNYPGLNPESYSKDDRIEGASMDYSQYPAFITFNFGIKTTLK